MRKIGFDIYTNLTRAEAIKRELGITKVRFAKMGIKINQKDIKEIKYLERKGFYNANIGITIFKDTIRVTLNDGTVYTYVSEPQEKCWIYNYHLI